MIKNIFLDRDGIINEIVMRDGIITSPRSLDEFKFRDDFVNFYEKIKNKKFNLFIVSNQPEIVRGLLLPKNLDEMTDKINRHFNFKEISYCKHVDSENCSCRKPKPGMINTLINKYSLKREESIIIGDTCRDIDAGKNAKITSILLKTSYNANYDCKPDYVANSLTEILISLPQFSQLNFSD